MIFSFIIVGFLNIIAFLMSFWPQVLELPFGADAFLSYAISVVFAFTYVFWPLQSVMLCLILYLGVKVALFTIRLILGARIDV